MTFCTLFDCNYLDKGIALYNSLERVSDNFLLYVLAMDDQCYNILSRLSYPFVKLVSMKEFENERLLYAKKNRTQGEYCWTCSSSLIKYVLEEFHEEKCTYVDADCYFFSNPKTVLEEMGNKHIQIISHWFSDSKYDLIAQKESGKYCVEFNTFDNSPESMQLLNQWVDCCIGDCSANGKGEFFGDQGYISEWDRYPFVSIVKNRGAGVAPWNIKQYKLYDNSLDKIVCKKTKAAYPLIFYHFHNMEYISRYIIKMNIYRYELGIDYKLIYRIYIPYLKEIENIRCMLEKDYGIDYSSSLEKKVCSKGKKNRPETLNGITFLKIWKHFLFILSYKIPVRINDKKDIIVLNKQDIESETNK